MEICHSPSPPGRPLRRRLLLPGIAALVLTLDQTSKHLVRTLLERGEVWPDADWPLRVRYVTNTGAAFGILQDQTALLIITTLVGLAAILLYYRNPPLDHPLVPVAVGMMLGGALGNFLDRVLLGRVTDFIDLPLWPAFNLADSSIVIGVGFLLLTYAIQATRPKPTPHEDPGPDR